MFHHSKLTQYHHQPQMHPNLAFTALKSNNCSKCSRNIFKKRVMDCPLPATNLKRLWHLAWGLRWHKVDHDDHHLMHSMASCIETVESWRESQGLSGSEPGEPQSGPQEMKCSKQLQCRLGSARCWICIVTGILALAKHIDWVAKCSGLHRQQPQCHSLGVPKTSIRLSMQIWPLTSWTRLFNLEVNMTCLGNWSW